ncbi:MAG: GNAT family N-acetyltransferase [Anaerovibrio sp.]|uniref:GNAT family N-acetyltransferase n=1 Tax=Anaerovibrio sp. TaxID=1872532 RepID=UPI0026004B40|nr:GNAT family N-acetyltransferase [Anaerovibrio sp.]MCR5175538.1 GNAT family N-acetyltransferase [Anaerovibrio sp.]
MENRVKSTEIKLLPLAFSDREQFIIDNQRAFNYGAMEEFGTRDQTFEEEGEIISRETIEDSLNRGIAYRIMYSGETVGGAVISLDKNKGELELLFIAPEVHSKGIGCAAWFAIEKLHPDITIWETCTPYFETRNIHFYVNCCGFKIVEFFSKYHKDPKGRHEFSADDSMDAMFLFEKLL